MKEKSIFPKPHRYAVCAQEDMPIKEFYKDIFDEVFIFYHPFIKPKSIAYELFNPEDYPSKNEIRDNCEMVNWERFMFLAGLKSIKQLDTGLRTNILGLKSEYQDKKAGKLILEACQKNKIVVPTEGSFPDFIMNTLLHSIKKLGHDWIWFGDEFCTERKLEYIDDLIDDNDMLERGKNLFTHDNHILITTHWDSHFSLLCSDRVTVERLVNLSKLEGFYCTEKTDIYWSLSD